MQFAAEVSLLKTGLVSKQTRSPLRHPRRLERKLLRKLNVAIPRFVGDKGSLSGPRRFSRLGLLSDSRTWPLAYHGLSTAMYTLSLQALSARKTRPGRAALRRAARASLALVAPDGDVTWFGRRQQEAWALASASLIGMSAARITRIGDGERRSLRAMARTAFDRLVNRHPITDDGLSNTPRPLVDAPADFGRGIQSDPINFNGLTVFMLNLAADQAGVYDVVAADAPRQPLACARSGRPRRRPQRADVVRAAAPIVWQRPAQRLRPAVAEGAASRWLARPGRAAPGARQRAVDRGPLGRSRRRARGRRYRPFGLRMRARRSGATTIVTVFRSSGRKSFTLPVSYRPVGGGGLSIGLKVPRRSDRVEITSFHPTSELQLYADGVADDEARISVTGLAGIVRRDGLVSCCEAALTATTLLAAPSAARRVTYRIAPGPLPQP